MTCTGIQLARSAAPRAVQRPRVEPDPRRPAGVMVGRAARPQEVRAP